LDLGLDGIHGVAKERTAISPEQ